MANNAQIPTLANELANILARLDQINDRLDTAVGEINTRIDTVVGEVNTRIDTMKINMQASERNNLARFSNLYVGTSEEALTELVNPSNNTEVAGFPETSGHISTMQAATLDEVLRQLGLGVEGNRAAKEQRLRAFIGLNMNPA